MRITIEIKVTKLKTLIAKHVQYAKISYNKIIC